MGNELKIGDKVKIRPFESAFLEGKKLSKQTLRETHFYVWYIASDGAVKISPDKPHFSNRILRTVGIANPTLVWDRFYRYWRQRQLLIGDQLLQDNWVKDVEW